LGVYCWEARLVYLTIFNSYFIGLGMTIDDISLLRERKNPMEQMLSEFENTQFNNLLLLISEMNRLDVLISLRPHLRNIKDHLVAKNNRPSIENELPLNHISLQGPSRPIAQKQLPEKFILVTHHELPSQPRQQNNNHQMETTSDSAIFVSRDIPEPPQVPNEDPKRKQFKHLWSNLKKWGQTAGITVLDVDKCIDEANTIESLHNHFNRAQQIVLVATEAYREHVCNSHPTPNSKLDIKRQLHEFMYMEYMTAGRQNHRFRVIVTSVEDKAFLPMGWPTSTIVYTFPENHVDIVRRLFENN
jgi:hypothetical protein